MSKIVSPSQGASLTVETNADRVVLTVTGENEGDFAQVSMGVGAALTVVRELQAAAAEASINAMLHSTKKEAAGE